MLSIALFALSLVSTSSSTPPQAKSIAAPPEDFALLRLPDPRDTGTRSFSALLPVRFEGGVHEALLPIDATNGVAVAAIAPDSASWDIAIDAGRAAIVGRASGLFDEVRLPAEVFRFEGARRGLAPVRIESSAASTGRAVDGFLLLANEGGIGLYVHRLRHDLVRGGDVGLVAYAFEGASAAGTRPAPLVGAVEYAALRVFAGGDDVLEFPMFDDGLGADEAAGDGVWVGVVPATRAGALVVQVDAVGSTGAGLPFRRTVQELLAIAEAPVTISADARASAVVSADELSIRVPLQLTDVPARVLASAEVWSRTDAGDVAVAWIGGIVEPTAQGEVPLVLHAGWLGLAGSAALHGALELRGLRFQDVDTFTLLGHRGVVPVDAPPFPAAWAAPVATATAVMKQGKRPSKGLSLPTVPPPPANPGLLLVHGYCSSLVWPTSDFTGYTVFDDSGNNRSHDEFAQLLASQADHYTSFGVVGHSQGGAAALHLLTFYSSGLDLATGDRRIQSLGTPYQGTALAGNAAVLGQVFGVGCGSNADMTYTGSSLWLANIPSWARGEVSYYTTSFPAGLFNNCHFVTNLFLADPEDGTTEQSAGQLVGGNNMGHKTGWCHTTAMSYPPQCLDSGRNAVMNASAAR